MTDDAEVTRKIDNFVPRCTSRTQNVIHHLSVALRVADKPIAVVIERLLKKLERRNRAA